MSDLFDGDKPMFTPRQRKNLREQLSKALADVDTDGPPTRWQDVYIPPSHLQALDPQRMVVEGMRGAGKSFWTGVLTTPDFLSSLGAQEIGSGELKSSLPNIHKSHRIALDAGRDARAFPQASELDRLLQLPGVKPEMIWAVAILRLFPHDPELGMPQSTDAYDSWTRPVAWAGEHPARLFNGLAFLDQRLAAARQTNLVVIDAIDRVSYDLSLVAQMGAGLLRVLLELRYAQGLRVKAFFREDVLSRASLSVVDASKLLNNKVVLAWSQTELYSLAFSRIAQDSTSFRNQFKELTGLTWKRDSAQRYVCHNVNDAKVQTLFWRALVGDYMGNSANKGYSYPYIFNHLSDGLERVAPRTFLQTLKEALAATVERYADTQHVIHHEAIKDGVREASTKRVTELNEDYRWVAPALACLSKAKATVPIDWAALKDIWLSNEAAVLTDIEAMRGTALIPWETSASTHTKIDELRRTLTQIGIVKIKTIKGQDERIEIPDIYRLAHKIGRNGGISTRRRV